MWSVVTEVQDGPFGLQDRRVIAELQDRTFCPLNLSRRAENLGLVVYGSADSCYSSASAAASLNLHLGLI